MYKLKQTPEDFRVTEITHLKFASEGRYLIYLLTKKNYNTIRALETISKSLHIPLKNIGFAGTKDKIALTKQYISIKGAKKSQIDHLELKDISLEFVGYLDNPISLGDLERNEFIITIREIDQTIRIEENERNLMPNYFGTQRFGENNIEIGKNLIKSQYQEAIGLILKTDSDYSAKIKQALEKNPKQYIQTLNLIPKRLLKLYLNAYQSFLWNKTLAEYLKTNKKNIQIPMIGFGTESDNPQVENIIQNILKKEKLSFRDFIKRDIPYLSLEGINRPAFIEIKNLKIQKTDDTIKLSFSLNKGSYATVAIAYLFDCLDTVLKDYI